MVDNSGFIPNDPTNEIASGEDIFKDEEMIYKGGPSQVLNYNTFTVCGLLFAISLIAPGLYDNALVRLIPNHRELYMLVFKALFFGPIFWSAWAWVKIYCHKYILTSQRFIEVQGVFNRTQDVLQLYRVKDIGLDQPFTLRIFGCGNIVLDTSDKSTPIVTLRAIKSPSELMTKVGKAVEIMRIAKGVREID